MALSIKLSRGHLYAWYAQLVDGAGCCWGAATGRDLSEALSNLSEKVAGREQRMVEIEQCRHEAK